MHQDGSSCLQGNIAGFTKNLYLAPFAVNKDFPLRPLRLCGELLFAFLYARGEHPG
jgi:hypothetical protein